MNEFGKSYCGLIKELSEAGLVKLRIPGHDKKFNSIHDGSVHQKRALEILGIPAVSVQGDICYHNDSLIDGVCGKTDSQFKVVIDTDHDFYRKDLILRVRGVIVGIMKGYLMYPGSGRKHFCSLNSLVSSNGYGMFFGGVYTPTSAQISLIQDRIGEKLVKIYKTIAAGKWPVIDVPSLDLVPRRFVGGGMSPQDLPALYESLQRESRLLDEQFKQNAVVISR